MRGGCSGLNSTRRCFGCVVKGGRFGAESCGTPRHVLDPFRCFAAALFPSLGLRRSGGLARAVGRKRGVERRQRAARGGHGIARGTRVGISDCQLRTAIVEGKPRKTRCGTVECGARGEPFFVQRGDTFREQRMAHTGLLKTGCGDIDFSKRGAQRRVGTVARCAGFGQTLRRDVDRSTALLDSVAGSVSCRSRGGQGGLYIGQPVAADEAFGLGCSGVLAHEPVPAAQFAIARDDPLPDCQRGAVIGFDDRDLRKTTRKLGRRIDMVRQRRSGRQRRIVLRNLSPGPAARRVWIAADDSREIVGERRCQRCFIAPCSGNARQRAGRFTGGRKRARFALERGEIDGGYRLARLGGGEAVRCGFTHPLGLVGCRDRVDKTGVCRLACRNGGLVLTFEEVERHQRISFRHRPIMVAFGAVVLRQSRCDGGVGNTPLGTAFGGLGSCLGEFEFGFARNAFAVGQAGDKRRTGGIGGGDPRSKGGRFVAKSRERLARVGCQFAFARAVGFEPFALAAERRDPGLDRALRAFGIGQRMTRIRRRVACGLRRGAQSGQPFGCIAVQRGGNALGFGRRSDTLFGAPRFAACCLGGLCGIAPPCENEPGF